MVASGIEVQVPERSLGSRNLRFGPMWGWRFVVWFTVPCGPVGKDDAPKRLHTRGHRHRRRLAGRPGPEQAGHEHEEQRDEQQVDERG